MKHRIAVVTLGALMAAGVLVPSAAARDAIVPSFDGAPLSVSFFPAEGLPAGKRAPTILQTHGWGLRRERDQNGASLAAFGQVGVGPLRRAGFNVLTWDSRGFGESGGTVSVDYKDLEGRDVQTLIGWLAGQPEAQLDAAGDPRVGMHGVSYAGGIELVAAGIDRRIDAIAPSIAWHSLLTALYRDELAKGGWGAALAGLGLPTATFEGLLSPAGPQSGTLDPHIMSGLTSGLSTGKFSAEDRAWFDSRGPTSLVDAIRVPTLLVQGTADTLFTPSEAMRNHEILTRNRVPLKMLWFCGGHGVCLSGEGGADRVEPAVIAWMQRWLASDRSVDTGPAFEWVADDARWRSTATFPPRAGRPIVAEGSGRLVFSPADASSGTAVAAGRAANAVNVGIPAPAAAADVVGEPALTLSYTGTGSAPDAHVFAQILDERSGRVLGNQVTPVALTLDGQRHTVTRRLEGVAGALGPSSRLTLQLTGGTSVYGTIHRAGDVNLHSAKLELPTADPSAVSLSGSVLGGSRTCLSRRRFAIRLRAPRGQRLRSARVTVAGKRVKVQRRRGRLRAIVDLRGRVKTSVRVVVVARTTRGRRVRETRVYRTCTPRSRRR